jgi:uncharacterized membrane protein YfcA
VFVIGGVYLLTTQKVYKPVESDTTTSNKKSDDSIFKDLNALKNGYGIIVGMCIIGLMTAMILLYLSAKIPKYVAYAMLIITFITLTIVGILLLSINQKGAALAVLLVIAVLGCLLYCFRDQI